jgi:hypothetical protein
MRKTLILVLAASGAALLSPKACLASPIIDEMKGENAAKIERGESVVSTIDKPGATWPEVRIYRKVKATPEEVTALFMDYPNASSYIENLDSAVVENSPNPETKDVRYTVRLPIISSISYLVRNRYEKTPEGYAVRWRLLEPPFAAKSAVGSLRVEKHGEESIICYANHVEPATSLVSGLRGLAVKEATKTVEAISKEAERRHKK